MYPRPIEHYFAPTSLPQALELLAEHQAGAKLLAGGQSLVSQLKARETSADCIIDLNRIAELSYIEEQDGVLLLGAMVRHADLLNDARLGRLCPILVDAVRSIGDPQIRNRGTFGGSLAFADVFSDLPVVALALQAECVAVKKGGVSRTLGIDEFFIGPGETALDPDEVLSQIRVPGIGRRSGGAYAKQSHVVNGLAIVSVGVQLELDDRSGCESASIVVGGLSSIPARATAASAHLVGQQPTSSAIARAAELASEEIEAPSDFRASATYRRGLIAHYVDTLTQSAYERASAAR